MRGEPQARTLVSLQATVNLCPISLRPKIKQLSKRPPRRGHPPPSRLPARRRSSHWSKQILLLVGSGVFIGPAFVRASSPIFCGQPVDRRGITAAREGRELVFNRSDQ